MGDNLVIPTGLCVQPYRLWTPDAAVPEAWYDASDASTITESGGLVSQWNDKSGSLNHAVQATGAKQPTTDSETINGLNVLTFNQKVMDATLPSKYTGTELAMFGVFNRIAVKSNSCTMLAQDSGSGSDLTGPGSAIMTYEGTGTVIQGYRGGFKSSASHPGNGVPYQTSSIFDGANHTIYKDGVAASSSASTGAFNYDLIALNARWSGSYNTEGKNRFAEVIVINAAVTTDNRQKIEGYLAHKWGLASRLLVAHPYKYSPPVL